MDRDVFDYSKSVLPYDLILAQGDPNVFSAINFSTFILKVKIILWKIKLIQLLNGLFCATIHHTEEK